MARIRPYQSGDLDALYDIALKTGEAGDDATHLYRDPRLVGHIYAAPYGELEPRSAFVAEDDQGVAGYIVGAVDTRAFEARCEEAWWPALRGRYTDPDTQSPDTWTADQTRAYQIHHPHPAPRRVVALYPSHLHINLLPRLQGQGVGRRMMDAWLGAMTAAGSPGAHLGVATTNARGLRFYRAYGWTQLELGLPDLGSIWFGMMLPR
ncbi:GNAT family N-acetyltransferase [Caulobacter sp. KR2-114]|uniref:GNAT family N-acetyltransferase n=1 Tax=Caulobacter sp. KR2-114 TaxID=3400912 RepID=UPI003BFDF8DD